MASLFGRAAELAAENGVLRGQVLNLERQIEDLRQAAQRERDLADRATEAHQKLINVIVEMKREGFINAPVGSMEKLDLDLDPVIMDAIADRSNGDKGLERQLYQWALREMRIQDMDASEVAQKVLVGASGEEE